MPNWFELPNEQLLETLKEVWYLKSSKLIGKLVRRGNLYFFSDIRSHEFRKVEYPENSYNKEIEILFSPEDDSSLNLNSYYEFYIGVRDPEKRIVKNRLLILYAAKKNYFELTPKPFIERRSKVYTGINIELADTIRKAIKTLTSDINREPETFIYELLQNADDYKDINKRTVSVKFTLTPNYLLLTHDGQPFNFQNVYALTGISQGDKRDNIETIGFKGIGFKSIFKDSNFAIVKSGGFEFKFDESCFPKEAKRPWQIIPVWIENYDEELLSNQDFNSAPVSIAIKPTSGDEKLRQIKKSYKNILSKVFQDDRILIFLRWIDRVSISDTTDFNYQIELNKNKERWFISTGLTDIEVEESVRNWLNKQIRDEDITIPEKYENIQKTKITFAVERAGSKLVGTTNSKVYNYLPTEIDFGFKFLINGDFIPDGSRTELHNNEWNNYLGKIAGKKFVEWLSVLGHHNWIYNGKARNFDRDYLNLVPNFSEPKALSAGKNTFFLEKFKEGFKDAIAGNEPISFVPTKSGKLEILSKTFIDETELSAVLTSDFSTLTGITLEPIHNDVGEGLNRVKALINEYGVGKIFTLINLKECFQHDNFKTWLKTPVNNFKVLKHLFYSLNTDIKYLLETEKIILTESGELLNAEEIYSTIPVEVAFISNNKINSTLKALLDKSKVELKTTKFNATEFLISNKWKVNPLLTTENNIINFWNFVYDNWKELKESEEIKKSLRSFLIQCKPVKADELNTKQVSATYLCKEMAVEDEVESIIESLKLKDKFFINPVFISKGSRKQLTTWTEIFAGAKRGLSDLIGELIPQLKDLEDSLHFKACNEIFKYWNRNKEKPEKQLSPAQIVTLKQTLKLKCENGFFLTSQCIIPEYYTGDKRMQEILPSVVLNCQITKEYQPKESFVSDWKQFFVLIGCKDLNSEQKIFNDKIDYLLANQLAFHATHFITIKEIDSLFISNEAKEVKLSFDFANKLSKISLQTSLANDWDLPTAIHLSSAYNPELDLQNDNDVSTNFKFLSLDYFGNNISIALLKSLGVKSNFEFILNANNSYLFYPDKILNSKKYLPSFWNFITATELRVKQFYSSNIFNTIKSSESILIDSNSYRIPSTLYSKKLSYYIQDKKLIPEIDLTTFFVDTKNSLPLEQAIGVNQELNIEHCLTLLKMKDSPSLKEVSELKIVSIIQRNAISNEQLTEIKLPSNQTVWMAKELLFTSNDSEIATKYPDYLLHSDFTSVAAKLQVKSISKNDLEFHYSQDNTVNADAEIRKAFTERAEYLAFALRDGASDFSNTAIQIVNAISAFTFIKCNEISKSISYGNLSWGNEFSFFPNGNVIYFIDEINSKKTQIRKWLFEQVKKYGNLKQTTFERIIFEATEKSIIEDFKDFENVPDEWIEKIRGGYKKEVEEFIHTELENTEWSEYIPELKSILELSISHPKEKQKLFNLVAKLKLAKDRNIHFESADTNYNHLENGDEKYFVHSARGSFAHIHTNEILQMKKSGYKMALDFGAKSKIKIYNTAEDILLLNTNHILAYQYEKSLDDLFSFCEANKDASKHLLILDKDNSREKSRDILKLLNPDDDYQ